MPRAHLSIPLTLLALGAFGPLAAQAATPPEAPAVGADVPYVDAEGVTRGLVGVREVADPFTEYREEYPPGEDARFVELQVVFEAAEDQSFSADPYDILVQDDAGFLWGKASVTRPEEATVPELSSQDMAPGNRISGVIHYIVPADAQLARVLYQPDSGRLITLADVQGGGTAGPEDADSAIVVGCEGAAAWVEETMARVDRASELSRQDADLANLESFPAHAAEYAELAVAQAGEQVPAAAEIINEGIVGALERYAAAIEQIIALDPGAADVTERLVEATNAFNGAGQQLHVGAAEVAQFAQDCGI